MDVTSEMARMADRMAGIDTGPGSQTHPREHVDAWTPSADIVANGDDLVVRLDLSGITRDEVDVTFSNGTLTMSGRRESTDNPNTVYYTRERGWGAFRRTITLPDHVDTDDITADLDDGLLKVTIRGAAAARGPAQIQIGSSHQAD